MIHYYESSTNPSETVFADFDPPQYPVVIPTGSDGFPMVEITEAAFDAIQAANALVLEQIILRATTRLQWSPSKFRTPASDLEGAYIVAGTQVAIFVEDVPALGITQIDFKLNGVSFNVENSAPWDANGTDGMGNAIRVAAVAGPYLIEADITDTYGVYTVQANVEVE